MGRLCLEARMLQKTTPQRSRLTIGVINNLVLTLRSKLDGGVLLIKIEKV